MDKLPVEINFKAYPAPKEANMQKESGTFTTNPVLLLLLIIAAITGVAAQSSPQTSPSALAMQQELSALQARTGALKPDSQAQRDGVLADWKKFAGKYGLGTHQTTVVKGQRVRIAAAAAAASEGRFITVDNNGQCPNLIEGGGTQCVKTHETQYQCEYFCVDIPKGSGKQQPSKQ